jgi:hypothetical protein
MPDEFVAGHPGQEARIIAQVAPNTVQDGQTNAARFDSNQALVWTRFRHVEAFPLDLSTPLMDAIAVYLHNIFLDGLS